MDNEWTEKSVNVRCGLYVAELSCGSYPMPRSGLIIAVHPISLQLCNHMPFCMPVRKKTVPKVTKPNLVYMVTLRDDGMGLILTESHTV